MLNSSAFVIGQRDKVRVTGEKLLARLFWLTQPYRHLPHRQSDPSAASIDTRHRACTLPRKHCANAASLNPVLMLHAARVHAVATTVEARKQLTGMIYRDQKQKPLAVYKLGHMRLSG
jgi:hypothetical protein